MNIGKKNKYAKALITSALLGSLLGSGAIAQAAMPEPLPPVPAVPVVAPVAPVAPEAATVVPVPTKPVAVKKTAKRKASSAARKTIRKPRAKKVSLGSKIKSALKSIATPAAKTKRANSTSAATKRTAVKKRVRRVRARL
jgi:hypothetical protein